METPAPVEPQNDVVNVKDQETGEIGSIPHAQLASALSQGYEVAAPEEIQATKDEQTYGGTGQQVLSALEGAGEGATFGLSTGLERAVGVKPEDIQGRRRTNPGASAVGNVAGMVGSSFIPVVGEANLLEKAGMGAAQAVGLGAEAIKDGSLLAKIGGGSVRGATEMALMQAGDENSKLLSGDPETTAQSVAANIGLSSVLGAGGGAALGAVSPLWKSMGDTKLGQMIEDFKGRIKEHLNNPNPVENVSEELSNYHKNITDMADEVYGATGLKAQEISKLMPPDMNQKITDQAGALSAKAQDVLDEMKKKPSSYPARLSSKLEDDLNQFNSVLSEAKTPEQIFNASQDLKQTLQGYSKFDKFVKPVDEAYDFVQKAKSLGFEFRSALEDSDVWGKAAERQQAINKAFKEYLPALNDFQKRFTTTIGGPMGDRIVDPAKINTYMNQLGKPSAEIKQEMLKNFLDASEKYKSVLADTHSNLGLENPVPPSSLNMTRQTLKEVTPGARIADTLIKKGLANVAGQGLGAIVGGGVGHMVGAGGIGALVGEHALGPFFSSILPAITKPLLKSEASGEGLKAATEYGLSAIKAAQITRRATGAIFKSGAEVLPSRMVADEKGRNKLDEKIQAFQQNPNEMLNVGGKTGHYLPAHGQEIGAVSARAVNYLNSIRPSTKQPSPLDKPIKPTPEQSEAYHRQLDIAEQPLRVLQRIKDGSLVPQDLVTLKTIYPALYQNLTSQIMVHMNDHLTDEEPIPYHTKMALSMFFGSPLDSTMTPSALQSTQFMAPQQQAQQQHAEGMKQKGSMKNVGKLAQGIATQGQNREMQKAGMVKD